MPTFRIDVDTKLTRKQRRLLQIAAFRWRLQIDERSAEVGPWRQDWGVQYECPAENETEARARVAATLGQDLGDHLIVTRRSPNP